MSPGGAGARGKGGISLASARRLSTSQPTSGRGDGAETPSSTGAAKKCKRAPTAAAAALAGKIGAAAKGVGKGVTRAEGVTKRAGGRAGSNDNGAGMSASKGVNTKETPRGTRGCGGGGAGRRGLGGGDGGGSSCSGGGGRWDNASGGRGMTASPMSVGRYLGRASTRSNETTPGHKHFPPRWGTVQGSELRV